MGAPSTPPVAPSLAARVIHWVSALGRRAGERPRDELNRRILVFGGLLMSGGGVLWASVCLVFGLLGPSLVPLGYVLVTVVNLVNLHSSRSFPRARMVQVLISLLLPFFFQWSLGGFVASGGVMLWAMIALVGSLTFSSQRQTWAWLALYLLLTLASGAIDAQVAARAPFAPSLVAQRVFFVLNLVTISSIVFGLASYLTLRQQDAIDALEAEQETTRQLAANLEAQVKARTSELETSLVRAEAGTRAKGEFLAVMSHEIRTPLNGILGTTDLLSLTSLDREQAEYISLIRRSGDLLLSIIGDVLDYSKIEAAGLELRPQRFSPRVELEALIALHRGLARERGLELRGELTDLPALLVADSNRLLQVVGNLLSNALKFTDQGSITVKAGATRVASGWRLDFAVVDTGVGIEAANVSRLFQPFTQADSSITRRYGGTGLGLAICDRIVRAMGGEITLESQPCVGTTFRFHVLVEAAEDSIEPGRELPALEVEGLIEGMRVLLAEDNPVNQTVALRLLLRLGCQVDVAAHGREAVTMATAKAYDLVLMDVQMPVLDGLMAAQEIRALSLEHKPRIVAVTANAFETDRQACREAGMDDFVAKPLRIEALRQQLLFAQHDGRRPAPKAA